MTSYLKAVVCLECGCELAADVLSAACPNCGSQWLDARYDYDAVAPLWARGLADRQASLWRYAELLPISAPDPEISLREGYTPLIRLYPYERLYEHPHLYVKDERQGPTSSFKDRQAALAVTAMRQAGITECVLASTGNAAAAYAAYCARAGIKLWLFLSNLVPAEKMREAALYGAEVVKVSGTYDDTKHVAAEFARHRGIHLDRGAKAVPGKESMKTLAFEIAEQLGLELHPEGGRWVRPDWYIQAVSGGIGPLGVWKGFTELHRMGLIDRLPKLGIVQVAGCAPMVQAFKTNKASADAVIPKTLITVLATGDPGFAYQQLRKATLEHGGTMIAVEDGEAFAAMRRIASKAGLSVEPATAVAFAGLEMLLRDSVIRPGESVVVNCSGHTFPAESHVLGDQYLLNLDLRAEDKQHHAGLSAALKSLDEQVTTVLVVDDNPHDRRLVRRMLRTYKHYRVFEAHGGAEALQMVKDSPPDLIVTDLTMPEMDGFRLLELLKEDEQSAKIPVVVLSAKALTDEDRDTLERYSESVWTKGAFETRVLIDHIVETLGDQPLEVIRRANHNAPKTNDAPAAEIEPRTVVIVDDNPNDLRLTRKLIEKTGSYRVVEAQSGRDGLKAIYEHRPDLVILDLLLPDMDGFSILRRLESDSTLHDISIIVYSGKEMSDDERAALQQSGWVFIEKTTTNRDEFVSRVIEVTI
jgi:threonine synthase